MAIREQKFGEDREVLKALVTNLPTFTDQDSQFALAIAISEKNLERIQGF